ncbi:fluoride efflux transporter CrcB [Agromyces aerolatus]|uniref:fluoride efflux transporter CrcB n=1 Tax=Agromyces sp. LY-1074 TaxID=3074080 RepID=UPI00285B60C2|nr:MULTISPECIES: fluoride efflux transporter CrcB [unclassified Agromyces]MDR5699198.1 fluoride efflux transporter CrcB [Agromyces sp. LY-1074]MDR5705494.1 fluoride efflux transporter CrcB [Agromyces sp. LY-1358]
MTPWLFLAVAAAGGVGAALRFVLGGIVTGSSRRAFPVATALINLTGSFALGLLTGIAGNGWLAPEVTAIVGVGLLGGYTTFSTASVETVRLAQERRYGAALGYGLGNLVACTVLALLGIWLGSLA